MTRRSKIEREIAGTLKIRDELYAEINNAPQYKLETEWFKERLKDIELLDAILDDLTAVLNVSILV